MVCKTIISTKEKILLCNSYLIHNQNLVNANSIIFNLVAKNLKGKFFKNLVAKNLKGKKKLQVFFTIKKNNQS